MIQPAQLDADLSDLNSLHLPARASRLQPVDQAADLPELTDVRARRAGALLVLGGGSNIVFATDFPGTVLHMRTRGVDVLERSHEDVCVSVAAGVSWHDWVQQALAEGWYGLENLALIPGTVGAAPVQNIGAYGVELKDHVDHVEAWDTVSRTWLRLGATECRFGYRDSIFKHELAGRAIITRVAFRLSTRPHVRCSYVDLQRALASRGIAEPTPQNVFDAVCAVRRMKLPDPAVLGNAGSFFRNPVLSAAEAARLLAAHPDAPHYPAPDGSVKFAAAWLIDQGGWKGRRIGDAGVHEHQALVLVNHGHASAAQLLALARAIQDDVRNRYGISLEPEPLILRAPA
jgi:UDP-N-acetylmuramate dehydrogenase